MKNKVTIKGKQIGLFPPFINGWEYSPEQKINELLLALDETPEEWSHDMLRYGDRYWFIGSVCTVHQGEWTNHKFDLYRLKTNNIYRTREDAWTAYKKIMES